MTDPRELCCPISHELMKDPVVAGDGHTYERSCIEGAVPGGSGNMRCGQDAYDIRVENGMSRRLYIG